VRKSKKSATPLQHWVAWKIASRAKELGVVSPRSEREAPEEVERSKSPTLHVARRPDLWGSARPWLVIQEQEKFGPAEFH
jgi:hypothetical protein